MDIRLYLVWLICSGYIKFCLTDSYEDRMVFVGENLEMRCDGAQNSESIYFKWSIISGFNFSDTLIYTCFLNTNDSCDDSDDNILDVKTNYNTSTFTIENVSLEDARQYKCEIRTFGLPKLCIFNVTIKEPPVGFTLTNENEGTAINSSFLEVRADVNTTIRCRANTSGYLQWYPNCSDLSYHACREGDLQNGSRALSFTPRASQNGTILTCRIETKDEVSGNVNTWIKLKVEVCVQHLEIFRNNSLESTVDGRSALSCQTNTSNFNLTSSSLFFNTSYQDGRGNEHSNASWETAGALHLASYKLDSNFSSLSCCVSKTSLCPGVCSEEYFNVLNDHPDITTVANTDEFPETVTFTIYTVGATVFLIMIVIVFIFVFQRCRKKSNARRVPGELDNVHGPGTHPTPGHNRGALPAIPTITADPSIHHLTAPSHVAQTNRRMARGSQDWIPLQLLVSPMDDTLERDQNRTMRARSNAGTRVKTVPVNPDVEYAVVNKKPRSGKCRADEHNLDRDISLALRGPLDPSVEYATVNKQHTLSSNLGSSSAQTGQGVQQEQSPRKKIGRGGNIPHVYTASASGLAEYAVVDTTREERKKGQQRAHHRNMAYHNPQVEYAAVDKTNKSRREK